MIPWQVAGQGHIGDIGNEECFLHTFPQEKLLDYLPDLPGAYIKHSMTCGFFVWATACSSHSLHRLCYSTTSPLKPWHPAGEKNWNLVKKYGWRISQKQILTHNKHQATKCLKLEFILTLCDLVVWIPCRPSWTQKSFWASFWGLRGKPHRFFMATRHPSKLNGLRPKPPCLGSKVMYSTYDLLHTGVVLRMDHATCHGFRVWKTISNATILYHDDLPDRATIKWVSNIIRLYLLLSSVLGYIWLYP